MLSKLSWLLAIALTPVALLAAERAPVPDKAAITAAEKVVRDVFKGEYAKTAIADRQALGQKLLKQGLETADDPASRYVLFRESMTVAAQSGDAETAVKAADEAARAFVLDVVVLKMDALPRIPVGTPEQARAVGRAYLALIDDAVAGDNYDAALKACAQAEAAARKAEDLPLTARSASRTREVRALQSEFLKVQAAQKVLNDKPADPAANLAVGKFLCFIKDDWPKGLECLGKCSEEALKSLATRDLLAGTDATQSSAAADSWWELAAGQPASGRYNIRKHAASLYRSALSGLSGLAQTKAKVRITEFEDTIPILERFQSMAKKVQAVSSGLLNQSSITIGPHSGVSGSPRGINVLAIHNDEVLIGRNYDTAEKREDTEAFAADIGKLPDRTLVVLAVAVEATGAFNKAAQEAIISIGGKVGLLKQKWRCSYICVGMKGLESGQAVEMIGQERLTYPPEDR